MTRINPVPFIVLSLLLVVAGCNGDPIQGADSHFSGDIFTYPDRAPVANDLTVALDEDTQKIVTLTYSDLDADLARTCSLTNLVNATVTQSCACVSGVCTVGITGLLNFNGTGSFDYQVMTKSMLSNVAVATLSIGTIDDAPIADDLTESFNEDTQKIVTLTYSDLDLDSATTCSLTNLVNVTLTQSCACVSGVCTVGITGLLNFNGAASFDYQVTTNSLLSNVAVATLSITAVDDAPVATGIENATILKNIDVVLTLKYTDVENNASTACTTSAHDNVIVSQACACASGVCTVTVKGKEDNSYNLAGATNAINFPYFTFTVGSNGLTSTAHTVRATCPIGFSAVPGNTALATNDFCVMKYEASLVGADLFPKSHPTGTLINAIDIYDAASKCTALGSKFDLMTNSEWMTLARNIELQSSNWSNGVLYDGCLKRGNMDNTTDACTYDAGTPTDNGLARNTKAKHVLSNGSEIWDLGGNLLEWVLWKAQSDATSTVLQTITQGVADILYCGNGEITSSICPGMTVIDLTPAEATLTSADMIGRVSGLGVAVPNVASLRGFEGVFGLSREYDPTDNEVEFGFRCVYRP